jgi:hypothetical protein
MSGKRRNAFQASNKELAIIHRSLPRFFLFCLEAIFVASLAAAFFLALMSHSVVNCFSSYMRPLLLCTRDDPAL